MRNFGPPIWTKFSIRTYKSWKLKNRDQNSHSLRAFITLEISFNKNLNPTFMTSLHKMFKNCFLGSKSSTLTFRFWSKRWDFEKFVDNDPHGYILKYVPNRWHLELLAGRLCRPDSEKRPLFSNFTTVATVCCHNST